MSAVSVSPLSVGGGVDCALATGAPTTLRPNRTAVAAVLVNHRIFAVFIGSTQRKPICRSWTRLPGPVRALATARRLTCLLSLQAVMPSGLASAHQMLAHHANGMHPISSAQLPNAGQC